MMAVAPQGEQQGVSVNVQSMWCLLSEQHQIELVASNHSWQCCKQTKKTVHVQTACCETMCTAC